MPEITEKSTLDEVAAIVSDALEKAGITATLSGGSAVTIYTQNEYLSRDLDFVTAAQIADLEPVMNELGFERTGNPRLSAFDHPLIDWYVEFPPSPLSFGNLYVDAKDCTTIKLPVGNLRIITPTQSVMDRLAHVYAWDEQQTRDQAIMVASCHEIDWDALQQWFANEGVNEREFERFRVAVEERRNR